MSSSEFDEEYDTESQKTISAFIFSEPLGHVPRRKTVTVPSSATVEEAIAAMNDNHVGCALIVDAKGKLVGIFTERDVLTRVVGQGRDVRRTSVGEVMTRDPDALTLDHRVAYAVHSMSVSGYRTIPVVDSARRPIGVVTVTDFIKWLSGLFPEAVLNLPPGDALKRPSQIDAG
jgi:CBS domain-containing protein